MILRRINPVVNQVKKIVICCLAIVVCTGFEKKAFAVDFSEGQFRARMGKGLAYRTQDKDFKVSLTGVLQADGVWLNTNETLVPTNSGIRRGRLMFGMQLYRDWDMRATYDFTADPLDERGFQNLYLRYSGIHRTRVYLGNMQEPIGLDWLTSSRTTLFMERAQMTALIPPLHLGMAASTHGRNWAAFAGLFGEQLRDGIDVKNGWGVSGRVVYTPIQTRQNILHVGLSGSHREPAENARSFVSSSRTFNVENARFSSLGPVRNFSEILSAELAAMRGPMSMQFEYLRTFTGKQQALEPPEFDSWYIQAGWVVTGEKRSYSRTTRTFDGVKPNSRLGLNGGTGAWEVGVRYSELSPVGQKQFGNKETNLTLGINWYPTDYMRVMANYIWVRSDLDFSRNSSPQNEHANIFAMRLQVQF